MPTAREKLLVAATAAHLERAEAHADRLLETQRVQQARVARSFIDTFDCEADVVVADMAILRHDGDNPVNIRARWVENKPSGHIHHWELDGTCPTCGKRAWSQPINDLADLGEMLAYFIPNNDHDHQLHGVGEQQPTKEQQIAQLLDQLHVLLHS